MARRTKALPPPIIDTAPIDADPLGRPDYPDTDPVRTPDNLGTSPGILPLPIDTDIDPSYRQMIDRLLDPATADRAKDTLRRPNIAKRATDALRRRIADRQDASPDDLQKVGDTAKTRRLGRRIKKIEEKISEEKKHADSAMHSSVRDRRLKRVEALRKNLTDQQVDRGKLVNKHLEKAGTKVAKAELKDLGYNRRERKLAMKDIVHVRRELGRLTLNLNVYNKDEKSTRKRAEIIERNLNKVTSKTNEIHRQSEMTETSVEAAKTELDELAKIQDKLMEEYAALEEELKDHPNPVDDNRVVDILDSIGQNARDIAKRTDEVQQLTQEFKTLSDQEKKLTQQLTALEDRNSDVRSRLRVIRERQFNVGVKIVDEKKKIRQGNIK